MIKKPEDDGDGGEQNSAMVMEVARFVSQTMENPRLREAETSSGEWGMNRGSGCDG